MANTGRWSNYDMTTYDIDFGTHDVKAGVVADIAMMPAGIVMPRQTHGIRVGVIGHDGKIPELDDTDALISLCPGVGVGVRTADCVPILIYASDIMAVAAIHAGWKGSLNGITDATVSRLVELGADAGKMSVAFGPSICPRCYEVSLELASTFAKAGLGDCITAGRHIDLELTNMTRLIGAGVQEDNIRRSHYCTRETSWLPSWRRDCTPSRLGSYISRVARPVNIGS